MNQTLRARNGKFWLQVVLLVLLTALFVFNAWVSSISNRDKYWAVDSQPAYVDQLRDLKPINIFQYFADAAGYTESTSPGQFIRYFVWLFIILATIMLFLLLHLFTRPMVNEVGVSGQQRTQVTSSTLQQNCPACSRRIASVGLNFAGSITCSCGATISVRKGVLSVVSMAQKPVFVPTEPRTVGLSKKPTLASPIPAKNDVSSRPSVSHPPTKMRSTAGTEFVTAPFASYSLQAEMSRAGIGSIEDLFELLDSVRRDLKVAKSAAERFDVSIDPNILRVVLSRLFLSSSVAIHASNKSIGEADAKLFKQFLASAQIRLIPVFKADTPQTTLDSLVNDFVKCAKIDGRSNPAGAIAVFAGLQVLFDPTLHENGTVLNRSIAIDNARSVIASTLIWLAATVNQELEFACKESLIGNSSLQQTGSRMEQLHQLWRFGFEIASRNGF